MRPESTRKPSPAGSVLVLVILAIVFLGALAAGVVSFLGTANLDTAASNMAEKVYYNAEAGFRYLANQYGGKGDDNGDGSAEDDKAGVLIALDGATVNLPGNLGSFTLDVHPYWFVAMSDQTATTSITVRFPGAMPPGYVLPTSGVLEVEDNSLHSYTSASVNAPFVTFTLADAVTLGSGKSVYMTLPPTGSQSVAKGGTLTLSTSAGSVFPDRNGQILAGDSVVKYATAAFDSGSNVLTLSGLTGAVSVSAGDRVVLLKTAEIDSRGSAGSGGFSSSSEVSYTINFDQELEAGEELERGENSNVAIGFENMEDWKPNPKFHVQGFTSGTGTHIYYAASVQPAATRDADSACWPNPTHIRYETLQLDKNALFSQFWSNSTGHLFGYDIQVKNGWGYQLDYGAGGLSFRLHESETAGQYNTFGLSFMRYNHLNSCTVPQGWRDYIPDSIKPSTAGGGSLANRCLLVLWKQWVSGGQERRQWVAYRDIENEACIRGDQWIRDGQCFTDNSSLLLRVWEKYVDGIKVSDISVYYGDASNPSNPGGCSPRTPNAIPNDYGARRQVYYPSYEYTGSTPYPTWPPVQKDAWNSTSDYFTFLRSAWNSTTCAQCTWSRVNPAATDFTLLSDGGTLRTATYVTPESGAFPANRDEIGLHNIGGGGNNRAVTFDDLIMQFLIPKAARSGGVGSAVQH
ncbi:MAG: hypothetical protein AB1916_00065 [Thermodesulfobacteriota bacterium]